MYEKAHAAYTKGRWKTARKILERVVRFAPKDGPSAVLLERVKVLQEGPVIENWNGVWLMNSK
jgi:adenylate cyclase